jgi:hypothetical protein
VSSRAKVFGVGFHKTGTTSLATALRHLGYAVTGPVGVRDPAIVADARRIALRLAERYDAFHDNPWALLYREMDQRFPGSKFVLTLRPTEDWIKSVVDHFGTESTPMREWIYGVGSPVGHEDLYVARYEQHNNEVRQYFKGRPNDILIMSITEGDGWSVLCPFLGRHSRSGPFPHANKREARSHGKDGGGVLRQHARRLRRRLWAKG